ncbi:MAG: hypothetical protein AAGC46_17345 [Solirubrobacteraceae bacterium]|nr:hypothetical protein [Patulibacter sp.]
MSPDHGSSGAPQNPAAPDRHGAAGDRAPLMPEVMDAMTGAVARRPGAPRRRRWLGRGAMLGAVVVLGSGTALAASGQWNPLGAGHHKAYTLAPAPAGDTETLAVLRRPQTVQDQNPLMTAFLRRVAQHDDAEERFVGRVYLRSIRYLRDVETGEMGGWNGRWHKQVRHGVLVLVPSDLKVPGISQSPLAPSRFGPAGTTPPPMPEHQLCLDTVYDAWPAGGPPPMMLRAPRPKHAKRPYAKPERPARLEDRISGGGTCVSLHVLRTKGIVEGAFNYGALTGVVPDGVAAVRITTRTGVVMTQRVVNNSFQLLTPGRNHLVANRIPDGRVVYDEPAKKDQFKHQTLQWLAADGRIIRHVPL